jgi:hypothetical protein
MGFRSVACRDRRPGADRLAINYGRLMSGAEDDAPHAVNPVAATGPNTGIDAAQGSFEWERSCAEIPGKGLAVR